MYMYMFKLLLKVIIIKLLFNLDFVFFVNFDFSCLIYLVDQVEYGVRRGVIYRYYYLQVVYIFIVIIIFVYIQLYD